MSGSGVLAFWAWGFMVIGVSGFRFQLLWGCGFRVSLGVRQHGNL